MQLASNYVFTIIVTIIVAITSPILHAQNVDSGDSKPVVVPTGYTTTLNIVYTKAANWEGKLDAYLPPKGKSPTPVVINIHGGGWNHGTKETQTGFSSFFNEGYAVVNIEYRLAPAHPAPAAIEDAKCALIYVVQHARQLNIDVNKIVIMGSSAGGHLALMAGMLANDKRFDTNCPFSETIRIAAIINKYGIADVWDWGNGTVIKSKSVALWLGNKSNDEKFAKSLSPISYVNAKNPPIFIVHGDADPVVPYQQSVDLHKALKSANVKTEFVTVQDGLHGKFPSEKNREVNKAIIQFIKGCLK